MRTIKQDVLAGLTCLGLLVAVSILAATPAHAQQRSHPGVVPSNAAPPASFHHHRGIRFIGGGTYWYPGYEYGYDWYPGYQYGYGYSVGGFNPGFADPYGVFGGPSIFDLLP